MFINLDVSEGDSLALLTSPVSRHMLSISLIQTLIPRFNEVLQRIQGSCISNGLYLNPMSIRPSFGTHQFEFYACVDVNVHQPIRVSDLHEITSALLLKPRNPREDVILLEPKEKMFPWSTKPSLLAICMELVRQSITNMLQHSRPWMSGIIPARSQYDVPLEVEDQVIDSLIRGGLGTILDEVDKHPTRLVSVTTNDIGVAINILCDLRVFLWTQDQEKKLHR